MLDLQLEGRHSLLTNLDTLACGTCALICTLLDMCRPKNGGLIGMSDLLRLLAKKRSTTTQVCSIIPSKHVLLL